MNISMFWIESQQILMKQQILMDRVTADFDETTDFDG